jgi:hypothetical protein
MFRSAHISECGRYRYTLWRIWDSTKPFVCFIMLNPSTADCDHDDSTIRKCYGFAQRLGYGGLAVINLFALCATDPAMLRRSGFDVGPGNDAVIKALLMPPCFAEVICAWGRHEHYQPVKHRAIHVVEMVRERGYDPKVLAWSQGDTGAWDGHKVPRHPLMLPYSAIDDGLKPLGQDWPWSGKL